MKITTRTIVSFLAIGTVLILTPASGRAVELGLTPSHVFELWTNINFALIDTGKSIGGGKTLGQEMEKMSAQKFEGKKPGEVLKQVQMFRSKLDKLASTKNLEASAIYKDPAGGTVTPSVVFLNSGHVLDGLLRFLINTDETKMISEYYTRRDIGGMTPSDAFSMVELANRRIDLIK